MNFCMDHVMNEFPSATGQPIAVTVILLFAFIVRLTTELKTTIKDIFYSSAPNP